MCSFLVSAAPHHVVVVATITSVGASVNFFTVDSFVNRFKHLNPPVIFDMGRKD